MSDNDNQSFRDQVEEVRDENRSESNTNDNEFEQRMEELEREAAKKDVEPLYTRLSDQAKAGAGVGLFIIGGILGAVSNPTQPIFAFFVIGILAAGVAWLTITKSGVAFRKQIAENAGNNNQQQQQQVSRGKKNERTVICQECGWKNPKQNNYCHDCGNEIQESMS